VPAGAAKDSPAGGRRRQQPEQEGSDDGPPWGLLIAGVAMIVGTVRFPLIELVSPDDPLRKRHLAQALGSVLVGLVGLASSIGERRRRGLRALLGIGLLLIVASTPFGLLLVASRFPHPLLTERGEDVLSAATRWLSGLGGLLILLGIGGSFFEPPAKSGLLARAGWFQLGVALYVLLILSRP
jgi:hypothetical protein